MEFRHHAPKPPALPDEANRWRLVHDRDAASPDICVEGFEQLWTTAPDVQREAAPELEFAVDLIGLPPEARLEPHALSHHPLRSVETAAHQDLREVRNAAILRQREQVVEERLLCIGAEVDVIEILLRQRRQHGDEILNARKREAERAAGEMRVAATLLERRSFEHEDARPVLVRRDRSA